MTEIGFIHMASKNWIRYAFAGQSITVGLSLWLQRMFDIIARYYIQSGPKK